MPNQGDRRFVVLDSWRGLAACLVALFHLRVYSHVSDLDIIRNAYLFVDFFFVLSGFVIAAGYGDRLADGFGFWRFMTLRFGRVYPLHLAVLLAFLVLGSAWPGSPDDSKALYAHLFLLHGVGLISVPVWGNVPSWSISTELFVYAFFAAAICALGRTTFRLTMATVLVMAVLIYVGKGNMREADGYQLARGLYGFAAGMLAWRVFLALPRDVRPGNIAELLAIVFIVGFVSFAGDGAGSVAAPVVFAIVVVVFAREAGAISSALKHPAFVVLGTLSYSIYMVHYFVARRAVDAVGLADSVGIPVRAHLGVEKWVGDIALSLYLVAVVAVSVLTYNLVEVPSRAWFRKLASKASMRPVNT